MALFQKLLVPYDFSSHSDFAVDAARDLARQIGATIQLVHIVQPPYYLYGTMGQSGEAAATPDLLALVEEVEGKLREVADRIDGLETPATARVLQSTSIADMICDAARDAEADLIVMGTHGRTGLAHVFLGSVAERTLRGAPCPVLTVQAPDVAGES